eukprot:scaffold302669_cov20-Prasinocladus_malaysianus.AAC.2
MSQSNDIRSLVNETLINQSKGAAEIRLAEARELATKLHFSRHSASFTLSLFSPRPPTVGLGHDQLSSCSPLTTFSA